MGGNEGVSSGDHCTQPRHDICQCFLTYAGRELGSLAAFHHVCSEPHGARDRVVERMFAAAKATRDFDA